MEAQQCLAIEVGDGDVVKVQSYVCPRETCPVHADDYRQPEHTG